MLGVLARDTLSMMLFVPLLPLPDGVGGLSGTFGFVSVSDSVACTTTSLLRLAGARAEILRRFVKDASPRFGRAEAKGARMLTVDILPQHTAICLLQCLRVRRGEIYCCVPTTFKTREQRYIKEDT